MKQIKQENKEKAEIRAKEEEIKKRNYGKFLLNKWDIFRAVEA